MKGKQLNTADQQPPRARYCEEDDGAELGGFAYPPTQVQYPALCLMARHETILHQSRAPTSISASRWE
jgi:hypothetical protein